MELFFSDDLACDSHDEWGSTILQVPFDSMTRFFKPCDWYFPCSSKTVFEQMRKRKTYTDLVKAWRSTVALSAGRRARVCFTMPNVIYRASDEMATIDTKHKKNCTCRDNVPYFSQMGYQFQYFPDVTDSIPALDATNKFDTWILQSSAIKFGKACHLSYPQPPVKQQATPHPVICFSWGLIGPAASQSRSMTRIFGFSDAEGKRLGYLLTHQLNVKVVDTYRFCLNSNMFDVNVWKVSLCFWLTRRF